jgi:polyisoprenyl-phosphate glycosyltransferase
MQTVLKKKISIVVPVYNEATNISILFGELKGLLKTTPYDHEFVFVDDGSTDSSLSI